MLHSQLSHLVLGDVLDGMMVVHWRIGRARCSNAQRLISMGPKQHCLGWDESWVWHASVATACLSRVVCGGISQSSPSSLVLRTWWWWDTCSTVKQRWPV